MRGEPATAVRSRGMIPQDSGPPGTRRPCRIPSTRTSISPDHRLQRLYDEYAAGRISRRRFIRSVSALAIGGLTVPAWMMGDPAYAAAAQQNTSTQPALDLAEWSYFFVGVERAELARATYVNGKQMYVESFVPAQ